MIRLLIAVLLFTSLNVTAEVTLTPLNNNTPADADDVMGNFNALKNEIESLPTPPSTCETNQIIKWNGTAWACAADPLANLSCSAGDALTYNGSAFTCSCNPPGTPITNSNFNVAITDWFASGDASQYGDITKWCTGAVTVMREAFRDKTTFNEDISAWDTSNVTDMSYMFDSATAFNRDISGWNTSNVTVMSYMFRDATAFNQDLSSWDASSVTSCAEFADFATAWLDAYSGSILGKTPPLSSSLIAAGCGN